MLHTARSTIKIAAVGANGYPLKREMFVRTGGGAGTVVNVEPDVLNYLMERK